MSKLEKLELKKEIRELAGSRDAPPVVMRLPTKRNVFISFCVPSLEDFFTLGGSRGVRVVLCGSESVCVKIDDALEMFDVFYKCGFNTRSQ